MNIHEYQAKALLGEYKIPIPAGFPCMSPDECIENAKKLGGSLWVVKAQIHAGGRGKAGGVKVAKSLDEVQAAAAAMLGQKLVTKQTGADGLPINQVFVETGSDIERELYLSMVVDRSAERIAFIASEAGGMDIEEVAADTPDKIFTVAINPGAGLNAYQVRKLGFGLGLTAPQMKRVWMGMLDVTVDRPEGRIGPGSGHDIQDYVPV